MMRPLALTVVTISLGASLVACGGGSHQAAVCGSVDTLKSDISDLKSTDFTSSGAISSVESQLTTIKSDVEAVKSDAKSQFSTQIQAVDSSYSTLESSLTAAKGSPSATNLAAVGVAATAWLTDVQTLVKDIQATC